jgi:uncharacterized protein YbgA (DUF1722 family)/uncharacterized protein YbbK (DUF523 family)
LTSGEHRSPTDFEVPRVVISKCLEFEACRYNGQVIPYDLVTELDPFVEWIPVCPEVEIGLGVPRDPIRLVAIDGEARLIQPSTERDLTDAMRGFSDRFLGGLEAIDGFILKNRSPSCGIKDVKVYTPAGHSSPEGKKRGLFAGEVLDRFPEAAIEDEGRLRNYAIREHFLTKLFARARFRSVASAGSIRGLIDFHADNKMLLMAYNQKEMRELGRLVGSHKTIPTSELFQAYGRGLGQAMQRAPRYTSNINVMMHVAGYFSGDLSREEKAFFQKELTRYRARRIPLSTLQSILRAWVVRFDIPYLEAQSFFEPYPESLMALSDSGKGRPV